MRAHLSVQAPAVALQSTDEVSHLHELKVRIDVTISLGRRTCCESAAIGLRAEAGRPQRGHDRRWWGVTKTEDAIEINLYALSADTHSMVACGASRRARLEGRRPAR